MALLPAAPPPQVPTRPERRKKTAQFGPWVLPPKPKPWPENHRSFQSQLRGTKSAFIAFQVRS
jgi:hypothetical protein